MENFRLKILSIVLIPVWLLSVTGVGIHLHYCNTNNQLFGGIHFASGDISEPGCCLQKEVTNSCCVPENKSSDTESCLVTDCCVDIYSDLETDDIYEARTFKLQFFAVEVTAFDFTPHIYSFEKPTFLLAGKEISPPDLISSVVLLL